MTNYLPQIGIINFNNWSCVLNAHRIRDNVCSLKLPIPIWRNVRLELIKEKYFDFYSELCSLLLDFLQCLTKAWLIPQGIINISSFDNKPIGRADLLSFLC